MLRLLRPHSGRGRGLSVSPPLASAVGLRLRSCACEPEAPPTLPAEPGTVSPHSAHVFVRLPPPKSPPDSSARQQPWWPPLVEKEPGVVQAFSAVAALRAKDTSEASDISAVKVSACIELGQPETSTNDVLIFPEGVGYRGLSGAQVKDVVSYHLSSSTEAELGPPPAGSPPADDLQESICFFVCCHGSRDARCGAHGPPLAAALHSEVYRLEGQGELRPGQVRVFQCSHIGGHKFAGNVIVYGALSLCDGDWFGGLRAGDARELLSGVISVDMGDTFNGGHDHPVLKKWWRGCSGLSKAAQAEVHAHPELALLAAATEAEEDGEDDESEEDEQDEEDSLGQELDRAMQGESLDSRLRKEISELEDMVSGDRGGDRGSPTDATQGNGVDASLEEIQALVESVLELMTEEEKREFLAELNAEGPDTDPAGERMEALLDQILTRLAAEEGGSD